MASSSSSPPAMVEGDCRNSWAELPPELTSSILHRLGAIEILENAQKVCRSWRRVCKDPSMWRKIDMHNLGDLGSMDYDLEIMCRHAIDRSQGGLVEIDLWYFGTDQLINYIADRSSNLKRLKLVMCYPITCEGLMKAVAKLPLLEDLEVSYCSVSGESLRVVGQSCPNLKMLKVNRVGFRCRPYESEDDALAIAETMPSHPYESDDDALAIAETMPRLRHLQIFGNRLTDVGLKAILDNCTSLEHLDLRQCYYINLVGDLEKRCCERVRVVRRPDDSTHDYPYDATVNDINSSEDGFSDIDLVSDDGEYFDNMSGASDSYDEDHYDYDDLLF
ncbi:unnamed protein product [Cochlearia groenlandica]